MTKFKETGKRTAKDAEIIREIPTRAGFQPMYRIKVGKAEVIAYADELTPAPESAGVDAPEIERVIPERINLDDARDHDETLPGSDALEDISYKTDGDE